jgi:hypothetical protein
MTSLTQSFPEALKTLRVQPLFVIRLDVPPLFVVGQTPDAFPRIGIVQGGAFEGERLSGTVLSGNDWSPQLPSRAWATAAVGQEQPVAAKLCVGHLVRRTFRD